MNAQDIIKKLEFNGIKIALVDDENISVTVQKGTLDKVTKIYIREHKEILVNYLKSVDDIASSFFEEHPIQALSDDETTLASYAQESLWFICQLDGEKERSLYCIPWILRIKGYMDLEAMKKTIRTVMRRHRVLNIHFKESETGVYQVDTGRSEPSIAIMDLSSLNEEEREIRLKKLLDENTDHYFNLSTGPLCRYRIVKLAENEYVLKAVFHHTIFDGWSETIFAKEFEAIYTSYVQGLPLQLPELKIQYSDYSLWLRERLTDKVLVREKSYWREKLANLPLHQQLPTDYPRPNVQSFRGSSLKFTWTKEVSDNLRELSRLGNTTLYTTLLSAFSIFMYRYSGQNDMAIGVPIANRNHTDVKNLIGLISNTVVMRNVLNVNNDFFEVMNSTEQTVRAAHNHSFLPFEKVVKCINPERNLSYSPLFQVVFVLHNTETGAINLPGLEVQKIDQDIETSPYDFTLVMSETENGLSGVVGYSTDLFKRKTIDRMIENFEVLIKGILAHPENKVASFPILTKIEVEALNNWSGKLEPIKVNKTIPQLFLEIVQAQPNAVAIVNDGRKISYSQLNQYANQIANHFMKTGVKTGSSIAFCMKPSIDLMASIVATLKIGCHYVPVDPEYPIGRIEHILDDSSTAFVVTQQDFTHKLTGSNSIERINNPGKQRHLVILDRDGIAENSNKEEMELQKFDEILGGIHNLAYINYTSGSTGVPKGVKVTQGNVINLVKLNNDISISKNDVVMQGANFAFDAFTYELWGSLLNGAKLILIAKDELLDTERLKSVSHGNEVSVQFVTTALFNRIVKEDVTCFSRLDKLLFGGENYSPVTIDQALESDGPKSLFHVYGPTECTTFSTGYRLDAEKFKCSGKAPIGKPMNNYTLFVLNECQTLVPIGVIGELYIGGYGVAQGYVNQDSLTAERFIQNPFSNDKNDRLYRTGDLVRWLDDGNLEFVGRYDNQVKISGRRIEPGEIEYQLSKIPFVRESFVCTIGNVENDKLLVAYIVAERSTEKLNVNGEHNDELGNRLKKELGKVLPTFMLPSTFIFIEKIPLKANGKINVDLLPEPANAARKQIKWDQPRNEVEREVSNMWMRFLDIHSIGMQEDFFDLGGHSLMATTLVNELRSKFNVEITLRDFYETPTVEHVASVITAKQRGVDNTVIPGIIETRSA